MRVIIVGAGISGLTLALELDSIGIECQLFEATAELRELGVGLNLMPHAVSRLAALGLEDDLARVAVSAGEWAYFNRFGQLILTRPAGRLAGRAYPHFSIHRADLQGVLYSAVIDRLGEDAVVMGRRFNRLEQSSRQVKAFFDTADGSSAASTEGDLLIGCDGVHSAVRAQLYPGEGPPLYSGITMWRGVTRFEPFLSGATLAQVGWLRPGRMVIYPIRPAIDENGHQLINWVSNIELPHRPLQDWGHVGRLEDFIEVYDDWHFDWLDVSALIRGADFVLEYPMIDREPLERWTFGRVTLLGDAAHPMLPLGGNGAAQSILDAEALRRQFQAVKDPTQALEAYERDRRPASTGVVMASRNSPSGTLVREVESRSGDKPFKEISDVITETELMEIVNAFEVVSGDRD